jgi:hypothetical protein
LLEPEAESDFITLEIGDAIRIDGDVIYKDDFDKNFVVFPSKTFNNDIKNNKDKKIIKK